MAWYNRPEGFTVKSFDAAAPTISDANAIRATTMPAARGCVCDDTVCGQLKHLASCSVLVCKHGVALLDYCGGCDMDSVIEPCCEACDNPEWNNALFPLF
jgi:hypothetical protein